MKKKEGRARILSEWDEWAKTHAGPNADGTHGLLFFGHLERNKPELLHFMSSGDKWQEVHGWLLTTHRVSD